MEFEERRLIDDLIRVSNKDVDREYGLFNGFGSLCYGRYLLGKEGDIRYYILHSFVAIGGIPILPVDYLIGYKIGNQKYIIGSLKWKDIKEYIPEPRKVFLHGALDGITCIVVFILIIALMVIFV